MCCLVPRSPWEKKNNPLRLMLSLFYMAMWILMWTHTFFGVRYKRLSVAVQAHAVMDDHRILRTQQVVCVCVFVGLCRRSFPVYLLSPCIYLSLNTFHRPTCSVRIALIGSKAVNEKTFSEINHVHHSDNTHFFVDHLAWLINSLFQLEWFY